MNVKSIKPGSATTAVNTAVALSKEEQLLIAFDTDLSSFPKKTELAATTPHKEVQVALFNFLKKIDLAPMSISLAKQLRVALAQNPIDLLFAQEFAAYEEFRQTVLNKRSHVLGYLRTNVIPDLLRVQPELARARE